MSVPASSDLAHRPSAEVLRALIEQARRRARRRRVLILLVLTAVAAVLLFLARDGPATGSAQAASQTVIRTNWNERVDFQYRNGAAKGFLRLYVRTIEVTRTSWKATVGVTNASGTAVQFAAARDQPDADLPHTYWAGPGIWWSEYVSGGTRIRPGSGLALTHSQRTTLVRPAFPTRLAARKSWFGTFSGSLAKVPKDRLLRIGFGLFLAPGRFECSDRGTACVPGWDPLSTTHQFRLPRRR
jgi:hypothetical protein